MAKKVKLNRQMRDRLRSYIYTDIKAPALVMAENSLRYDFTEKVCKIVADKYPQEHMQILHLYSKAADLQSVYIARDGSNRYYNSERVELVFSLDGKPDLPQLLKPYSEDVYLPIEDHPDLAFLYGQIMTAHKQRKDGEEQVRAAYTKIVNDSMYVEDLLEVWPEAEDVLKLPSKPIDPDKVQAMEIIKQNMCERGKAGCEEAE